MTEFFFISVHNIPKSGEISVRNNEAEICVCDQCMDSGIIPELWTQFAVAPKNTD